MHCPHCRAVISPRWVKDAVLHPEEPPLFAHYECPKCWRHLTPIEPTALTEQAVRRLGFRDAADYAQQVLR